MATAGRKASICQLKHVCQSSEAEGEYSLLLSYSVAASEDDQTTEEGGESRLKRLERGGGPEWASNGESRHFGVRSGSAVCNATFSSMRCVIAKW